jgi:peptidoglycan/xylan/chitin deacetylase (PgdA/CDA1 family)
MAGETPWICLVYHDVTPQAETSGASSYFTVSAGDFARQLDIIADLGLRGCSIADALVNPRGTVGISFDDGDTGQAERAFPALHARGMTATFFVTTSWVGTPGYASWEQLRDMRAAGMSIQSHTHTHPFLSELDAPQLREELRRAREILDERLGQRTSMIALPGGDAPRADLRSLLSEEGYDVVATSRWGRNAAAGRGAPRYVKRCTVRGNPDPATFSAIVTGDAWLNLRKQARERVLAFLRSSLGPTRYARWRRGFLDGGRPSRAV